MTSCLITGGAGFIGVPLARRLLALGWNPVRVLDNTTRARCSIEALCSEGIEATYGDIRDLSQVRTAVQGCDVVFHLAAKSTVLDCELDPATALAVNVAGTQNVLAAARALGVRRIIFASSREVYGESLERTVREDCALLPKNTYGASKAAAEVHCASAADDGMAITVLRLANVYGAGDRDRVLPRFIQRALTGDTLEVYGGTQVLDFVWIDRVVDAFIAAATGPYLRGSANVGSGKGVTILETANRVLRSCNASSSVRILPAREADVRHFVADASRASRELGLVLPQDPLAELNMLIRAAAGQSPPQLDLPSPLQHVNPAADP